MEEYIANNLWIIWSIIALLCLLAELSTGGFYLMCFAFGALLTIPCSLITNHISILLAIFGIISLLSMFFIRPLLVKFEKNKKDGVKRSNIDAIIGQKGTVTQAIEENGYGRVSAGGDDWKACTENGMPLPVGTKIEVTKQDSIILTVKEI